MPSPLPYLLDSNVLVAALAEAHQHHEPSAALLNQSTPSTFCVSAHSYAEVFNTLTRRGAHAPFRRSGDNVWAALQTVAAMTRLVGLTPAQTFDAVRAYAAAGGIGPRIYDRLIGQAAVQAGADAIVTWNTGHMRSLFPDMAVETPTEFLDRTSRQDGTKP